MQHVVYDMVRRVSSVIKFDRVEIAVILSLFYWLNPLTDDEGGGGGGGRGRGGGPWYPEKTPDELQKMPHTEVRNVKPQPRLKPALWHWWQARKADVLTVTPRVAPTIGGRLGKQTC